MSITHGLAIRNQFATTVSTDVETGAGAGKMVLFTGVTEVATILFNEPAFTGPVAGVLTLDVVPIPEDSSATGNASAVDNFEVQDGVGLAVFAGDAIPGDITLSKNPIDPGDVVQIQAFSYTASP